MRVHTFMSKLSVEALVTLDQNINDWLEKHQVEPRRVTQATGIEKGRGGREDETVVVVSVWY